jgi:HEAT repeat protein
MGFLFKRPDFDRLRQSRDEKGLVRLLHSRNAQFREQAARALGDIQARSSVEELRKLLVDDQDDVRAAVIRSLTVMGWQPKTSEERIAWFFARGSADEAANLQDADVPRLIRLACLAKLKSTRVLAVKALGYRYNVDAIRVLIRLLALPESEERIEQAQAAEQALVRIGEPAVPQLQDAVASSAETLAKMLFGPGQEAQLPTPVFIPRPDWHIMLEPAERMKQKAENIIGVILARN